MCGGWWLGRCFRLGEGSKGATVREWGGGSLTESLCKLSLGLEMD